MRSAPRTLAALLAAALTLSAPAAASASEGSVPPEVRAYVTGGGLLDRLDDVYGDNGAGSGIAFDETTTPGAISRVFHFTDERIAGDLDGKATRMVNEWAVPVVVAEKPVGVAILWINTDTELPELAEFQIDADAALALAAVPEAARLVRDLGSDAWFALADEILTPLVPGTSGVTEPTVLDEVALVAAPSAPDAVAGDATEGLGVAIAVALVLLAVVTAALLLPGRRTPVTEDTEPRPSESDPAADESRSEV